jgi:NADH-quinone oxidoreductase subunit F/NADP-reducing hydrogenase subunit HndC
MEHIHDKKCRSGKCKKLIRFLIDQEKCIGCGACSKKCPVNCITQIQGTDKKRPPYRIEHEDCLKCGECFKTCKFNAISKA